MLAGVGGEPFQTEPEGVGDIAARAAGDQGSRRWRSALATRLALSQDDSV